MWRLDRLALAGILRLPTFLGVQKKIAAPSYNNINEYENNDQIRRVAKESLSPPLFKPRYSSKTFTSTGLELTVKL